MIIWGWCVCGTAVFNMLKLTVVAVLVLVPADGSIGLHLQEEPLLAEEARHDALQLRL